MTFTEHFNQPIPDSEIPTTVQVLDENWLMCPDCVDAWVSVSKEDMVICPKCDQVLHNSGYQPMGK